MMTLDPATTTKVTTHNFNCFYLIEKWKKMPLLKGQYTKSLSIENMIIMHLKAYIFPHFRLAFTAVLNYLITRKFIETNNVYLPGCLKLLL